MSSRGGVFGRVLRWGFSGWRLRLIAVGIALGAIVVVLLIYSSEGLKSFGGEPDAELRARMEASPRWRGDRFVNQMPTQQVLPGSNMMMIRRQMFGDEQRVPPSDMPVVMIDREGLGAPPAVGVRATWIGHSTVLVEIDGHRVLTDPVWAERVSPSWLVGPLRHHPVPIELEDLPEIAAVVISHDHYDHLDMETARFLARRGTVFVVPLGIGGHLRAWEIDAAQIVDLDWWETHAIGDMTIHAVPARHYSGRLLPNDGRLWAGWVLQGKSSRVYYSGDTGLDPRFREIGERLGPFDLAIVKIGAYGEAWPEIHITPEEAMDVFELVGGKLMFPVHWGTFNLAWHDWDEPIRRAVTAAERRGIRMVTPRVGERVTVWEPFESQPWWDAVR